MTDEMGGDREVAQFRQQHYGLFVTLLANEPTTDLLAALGRDIGVRAEAARALHPLLGQGWETLAEVLPGLDADAATAEFLRMFIGPFQPESTPYESWYLTGQLFQKPLVDVRGFMKELGLEREEQRFPEPEDVLAFELEIMNWLVTRQLAAQSPQKEAEWLQRQEQFLREHLLVWAPACTEDMERTKSALFYRGVAQLLRGFLAWERAEFQRRGMGVVNTLEQARKGYSQVGRYRGPIAEEQFNAAPPPKTE
jgi:TorA maturation chaperone TorD